MSPPLPPTEAVRPGLWSIGVPFPDNPLGYTLVYLIESDRGPVLVDAGWDDDESWDALVEGFRTAGTDVSECYGVLVTHVHPDHHGLSGRVREASDAWVAMHERDAVTVERLSSAMEHDDRHREPAQTLPDFTDELMAVLLDAGASEDELAAAPVPTVRRRARRFRPLAAPDRTVDDGARVDVPGWDIAAVWTPGHTPGHLCFHVPEHRCCSRATTCCRRSPRTSRSPGATAPATRSVTSSTRCRRWLASTPTRSCPRTATGSATSRSASRRSPATITITSRTSSRSSPTARQSLWQIAARLTWNRPWDQFPLGLRRSAVNETAAHLRYLTRRHRAVRFKGVRPFTFGLTEGYLRGDGPRAMNELAAERKGAR